MDIQLIKSINDLFDQIFTVYNVSKHNNKLGEANSEHYLLKFPLRIFTSYDVPISSAVSINNYINRKYSIQTKKDEYRGEIKLIKKMIDKNFPRLSTKIEWLNVSFWCMWGGRMPIIAAINSKEKLRVNDFNKIWERYISNTKYLETFYGKENEESVQKKKLNTINAFICEEATKRLPLHISYGKNLNFDKASFTLEIPTNFLDKLSVNNLKLDSKSFWNKVKEYDGKLIENYSIIWKNFSEYFEVDTKKFVYDKKLNIEKMAAIVSNISLWNNFYKNKNGNLVNHLYLIPVSIEKYAYDSYEKMVNFKKGNPVSILAIATNKPLDESEFNFLSITTDLMLSEVLMLNFNKIIAIQNKNQIKVLNQVAIISILIDSYAHNISAHSLAALELWFQIRSQFLERKIYLSKNFEFSNLLPTSIPHQELKEIAENYSEKYYNDIGLGDSTNTRDYVSLFNLVSFFSPKAQDDFLRFVLPDGTQAFERDGDIHSYSPRLPIPLDYYLKFFLRFMRDKAAFWSGVTRDIPFGGETKNIYDILWNYLTLNALYLGTIAHSEGIVKLNIKIQIGENIKDFVYIDLSVISYEMDLLKQNSKSNKSHKVLSNNIGPSLYNFIKLGKDHSYLRNELIKEKIFFPGGIVGIHSFLTIIENTLRNIKHYKNSPEFSNVKNNGIDLLFKFKPVWLMGKKKNKEQLYEVDVSLNHPNYICNEKNINVKTIMQNQYSLDVLSDNQKPKLGGSSQDKICTAMLFNNYFLSVNSKSTKRDKYYNNSRKKYYWIGVREKVLENNNLGIISKFFNLWRGDFVFSLKNNNDLDSENLARFKIVYINEDNPKKQKDLILEARNKGVIRIITKQDLRNELNNDEEAVNTVIKKLNKGEIQEQEDLRHPVNGIITLDSKEYNNVYNAWIKKFLHEKNVLLLSWSQVIGEIEKLNFVEKSIRIDELKKEIFDYANSVQFEPNEESLFLRKRSEITLRDNIVAYAHGTPVDYDINFRSHGKLAELFYQGDPTLGKPLRYKSEFIETLLSNVILIDDRIYERFDNQREKFFKTKLNLEVLPENVLFTAKQEDLNGQINFAVDRINTNKLNFLVIHLTAIENIGCKGKDINRFIKSLLAKLAESERNKFFLIITTGRGRADWYDLLETDYKKFTIFRPIESFLSAFSDAQALKDDFDYKYNIIKVIFGS